MPDIETLAAGAIQAVIGLVVSTGFLLALFVGFCVVAGFSKFRKVGRDSLVHRNLSDKMDQMDGSDQTNGGRFDYLSPNAPRGQVDQLCTPELLEQAGRKD